MPAPEFVVLAAAFQEFAQARQHGQRPDQVPPRQRQQGVEVAAHIEARPLARGQGEHEMRTHEVEHRRLAQAMRHKHAPFAGVGHAAHQRHCVFPRAFVHPVTSRRRSIPAMRRRGPPAFKRTITQLDQSWKSVMERVRAIYRAFPKAISRYRQATIAACWNDTILKPPRNG